MKIHQFIGDFDLGQATIVSTDRELYNQIKNVLRLKSGDLVILANGVGERARATFSGFGDNRLEFAVQEKMTEVVEPEKDVTLYCAILKRENFELVVQKATECGVKKIVPLISARTVKTGLKMERLEKIVKEASEQAGRGVVPEITEALSLNEALELAKENDTNIFFDLSGEKMEGYSLGEKNVGIFIGPEGGWTPEETAQACEQGCMVASLGALTLRGETAAIIASYLAVHE